MFAKLPYKFCVMITILLWNVTFPAFEDIIKWILFIVSVKYLQYREAMHMFSSVTFLVMPIDANKIVLSFFFALT